MVSKEEVDKLRIAWQEADALSRVYQGLARGAMAKYMAAIEEPDNEMSPTIIWEPPPIGETSYAGKYKVIVKDEEADDEPTHRQPPAKFWERMNIDGLTGDVTFLPEDETAADENWNLQADIAPVTLEDVFTYIADQETDDV